MEVNLNRLLSWLQGKKTLIFGALSAVNTYLMAAGAYEPALGALIQTVLTLLSGGAAVMTGRGIKLGKIKR